MSSPPPSAPRRVATAGPSSTAIFLVLRRMRLPLIVLIVLFTVSVFGLTLVPGTDSDGNPWRMDVFDAFYFMSYTATTIGFGEIPHAFSPEQRLWVTVSIYLSVIGWAYAIGTVLALLQDRGFRDALSLQRFTRSVQHLHEPFLLLAGFGQAGEIMGRALDDLDRRFVVLDLEQSRIDALDLAAFRSDVPGHAGDARNPEELVRAGLTHPSCAGVIAMTSDDEANLAVVMSAALLRPDLPVVARTVDSDIDHRMREFGHPIVIDPFNLFGDELMLALRSPATYRLVQWLTSPTGTEMPTPESVAPDGRWVVCGYGRFGSHLADDLARHGLPVTIVDPVARGSGAVTAITGDATDPDTLALADLDSAVGFAAATDNDTTNLSLIRAARRANPRLYTVARQNEPVNAPLFDALAIDSVLVPTHLVAHEALARIGDPMLWHFLQQARLQPDEWSTALLARLGDRCGGTRPYLWDLRLSPSEAPAVARWLSGSELTLGALLADPEDREHPLDIVPLLLRRDGQSFIAPGEGTPLAAHDALLLAGMPAAQRSLDTTVSVPTALEYVATGRRIGNSWVWRTLVNRD